MANQFPNAKNVYLGTETLYDAAHSDAHNALEDKVGVDNSTDATSIDYLLKNTSSSNPGHKHTLEDGATDVTASVAEINYVEGVTSSIQTQLNTKAPLASPSFTGTIGINTAPTNTDIVKIGGSLTANRVNGFLLNPSLTPSSGNGAVGLNVAGGFVLPASGTFTNFYNLVVGIADVQENGATLGNTASLYIAGAMTPTVSGANYALFVDGGNSRFDGPIIMSGGTSGTITITPTAVAGTSTLTLPAATDTLVGKATTDTLTNKRITARTGTTTSHATPTINTDNVDFYSITAQAEDITSMTTNLSGTPTERQTLWIAITGTAARAITWGASFENGAVDLPTTTVTTQRIDIGFVWNTVTSKWRCMAVGPTS